MRSARRAALLLIRAYQLSVSSLLGRQCRYLPTCSDYACEAIEMHGLRRGGTLAVTRICRCRPWGGSGYDPVPRTLVGSGLRVRGSRQERASNCADSP